MEIILLQDVPNLGNKNDVVTVRNGYARNYLIPRGMAVTATESAKKVIAENIKQQAHKERKIKAEVSNNLPRNLRGVALPLVPRRSSTGKILDQ